MSLYDDADELFREVSGGKEVLEEKDLMKYLRSERFTEEEAFEISKCFQRAQSSSISIQDFRKGYAGFISKMSSFRKLIAVREKDEALLSRGLSAIAVEQFTEEFLDLFVQSDTLETIELVLQNYWQDRLEEKGYPHQTVLEVFMMLQTEIAEDHVREIVEKQVSDIASNIERHITSLLLDKGIKQSMTLDVRDEIMDSVVFEYVNRWCSEMVNATTSLCCSAKRCVARSKYIAMREYAQALERCQRRVINEIVDEILAEQGGQIAEEVWRDELRKDALEAIAETFVLLLDRSFEQVRMDANEIMPGIVADFYDQFYRSWRTWKTRTVEEAAQKVQLEAEAKEWQRIDREEAWQFGPRFAIPGGGNEVEVREWSEHWERTPQIAKEKSKKELPGGLEWAGSEEGRQWVHTFTEEEMADQGQDTIDRLKRYLTSQDRQDRVAATRTLAIAVRGGHPELISLYGKLACDPDNDVRRLCCPPPPPLAPLACTSSSTTQLEAQHAQLEPGPQSDALHDTEADARHSSQQALRMAMEAGHSTAEEVLVLMLQHDDRAVQLGALEMLRDSALNGSNPVIHAIVWQQQDPDDEVRGVVQSIVAECAARGFDQALYGIELMLADPKDTSEWLRSAAQLRALCRSGHAKLRGWASKLSTDRRTRVRKQAIHVLGGCTDAMDDAWVEVFGDPEAEAGFVPLPSTWREDPRRATWDELVGLLCQAAAADDDDEVRRTAVTSLRVPARKGHAATLRVLIKAMRQDKAPRVRLAAAKELTVVPASAADSVRAAITDGFRDESALVREACVVALSGECGVFEVQKAMLDAAAKDSSRFVREEALGALHLHHRTDDIDALRRLLREFGEEQQRQRIAAAAEKKKAEDAAREAAERKAQELKLGARLSSFADDEDDDDDEAPALNPWLRATSRGAPQHGRPLLL